MKAELGELGRTFPRFGKQIAEGLGAPVEHLLPPVPASEIEALQRRMGVALPPSYRDFLLCTRGFLLMGGLVQMSEVHPFLHDLPPYAELSEKGREVVRVRGGVWPPPSQGMLCFAEFCMEADGDQVLFDIKRGSSDGEYPVMYYAHEDTPASVREIAPCFRQWLETFLEYPAFADEEADDDE